MIKVIRSLTIIMFLIGWILLFSVGICYSQQQPPVTPTPPCVIPFFINSTGTGRTGHFQPSITGFDNRQAGCSNWNITYSSTGYSVINLQVESAPALSNTAPGTPGTYVAFAGTVVSGINPNTDITQATTTFSGYFPWIRINATTLTGSGTVIGVLVGTLPITVTGGGGTSSGGCVGTVGTPCIVAGPDATGVVPTKNPILIAGIDIADGGPIKTIGTDSNGFLSLSETGSTLVDGSVNVINAELLAGSAPAQYQTFPMAFNGAVWDREFKCSNNALFNLSGSGNTQIIAASGSTIIKICALSFSSSATFDFKLTQGTGANCGTGTADVTGLYKGVLTVDFEWGPLQSVNGNASQAICINSSAANTTGGMVQYAQY